jgi:hypothetical protein
MFLRNEIVYLEGNCEDKIYVIYTGMFKLQKNSLKTQNIDVHTNRNEIGSTILFLVREDISGLESCKKEPYRYTLQCDMDYSSLFEINLHRLDEHTKERLFEILVPILKKKQNIENDFAERRSIVEKYTKVTYREENIMNRLKSIKTKQDLDTELKMTEDAINDAKGIVKETPNDFKDFKLIYKSTEKLKTRNKQQEWPVREFTTRSFHRRVTKTLANGDKTPRIMGYSFRNKGLFITGGSTAIDTPSIVSDTKKLNSRFNSTVEFRVPTLNNTTSDNALVKQTTTISLDRNVSTKMSLKMRLGEKFNMFKSFISKIIHNIDESPSENKIVLAKSIRKNLKEWKKIVKDKNLRYSTGSIQLPLITQLKSV